VEAEAAQAEEELRNHNRHSLFTQVLAGDSLKRASDAFKPVSDQ
jgi:hypothetical protein